jgi:hypothetical protein
VVLRRSYNLESDWHCARMQASVGGMLVQCFTTFLLVLRLARGSRAVAKRVPLRSDDLLSMFERMAFNKKSKKILSVR